MIVRYMITRLIAYMFLGMMGSLLQMSAGPFWAMVLCGLVIEFSTRWETEEYYVKMIKEATGLKDE